MVLATSHWTFGILYPRANCNIFDQKPQISGTVTNTVYYFIANEPAERRREAGEAAAL